jgi:leucyl aminopeptidase
MATKAPAKIKTNSGKSKSEPKTKTKTKTPPSPSFLNFPDVLPPKADGNVIPVHVVEAKKFESWAKKQPANVVSILEAQGWTAKANSVSVVIPADEFPAGVYVGCGEELSLYTLSHAVDAVRRSFSSTILKKYCFALEPSEFHHPGDMEKACIGWALACYRFDAFKKSESVCPRLVLPKGIDKTRVEAMIRSISLIRNLINLPANALGPSQLADAAIATGENFGAKVKVVSDQSVLAKDYPLIHAVGHGSDRPPRLVDLTWGNPRDPKVTLVGKGVCFDTGGYDLKPSSAMLMMKKDMGGAAMALGLAWMVMSLKIPVRLRVLIPAVENSVSGRAFRPMDIFPSRKGLTVEIGNTDAEGRLVMADCLTLACEENPDLLIDFSTLTGAARVALGYDIPAMFSNDVALASSLQKLSMECEDPLWQLPLWDGYKSDLTSPNADLTNSGHNPAGSITAALFLEKFVEPGTKWIHIDHYAWEASGKPGRPKGGADTGMRAVLALLESKYRKKKA